MPFQCRTCAGVIYNARPKNLFSVGNANLLLNLLQVTGAVIDNDPAMPSSICGCCLHDLKLAIVFRERCLQTQKDLLQRGKIPKKDVSEREVEVCEPQEEDVINGDNVGLPYVVDDSPEAEDDFLDEFDGCLDVGEEPAEAQVETDTLDTIVTEEFETIYETSTEEFFSRVADSESEVEEDCNTDFSFPSSSRRLQPDREKDSLENEGELERDGLTDNSCPVSPVQSATVKKRGRPRGSTKKSESVEPKPRKRNKYVTWKNMTEDQIVARKRQQRIRDCVCEQCGRHFTDQSNFKLHMLRHTGIRNFACKECGKRFYTDHLRSLHQRIVHKGERPYSCRFCTKTFQNSTTRVIHERIHTKTRPYSCSHCDKTFNSASGRKRHELIHTGIRAYSCSICEQSFQRNTHLKAHLRSKMHAFRAESNNIEDDLESDEN